jgi:2-polyprenyl-3-methyl-5-hydroxy-6-metoxy-1,4-benzoquinol methylase
MSERPGTLLRWQALKKILEQEINAAKNILDVGGFDGVISDQLRRLKPELKIVLLDIDHEGVFLSKQKGLSAINGSVLELPIKSQKIDLVLCLDLIEHVDRDGVLLKEIAGALKENGIIILTTPKENGVSFPFLSQERSSVINREGWGHVLRKGYSLKEIQSLFEANNIKIIHANGYFNNLTKFFYWFSSYSGIPLKGKGLLYRAVIKLEPYLKWGADEHIIIGQKICS